MRTLEEIDGDIKRVEAHREDLIAENVRNRAKLAEVRDAALSGDAAAVASARETLAKIESVNSLQIADFYAVRKLGRERWEVEKEIKRQRAMRAHDRSR